MAKPAPPQPDVQAFLESHHGSRIRDLVRLEGGFWSSAYAYACDGQELVLRLGLIPEGFEADRAAMAYDGPDLPVPQVLFVGEALGWACAISDRRHGGFLEEQTEATTPVRRLLNALRRVERTDGEGWSQWLQAGLADEPGTRMSGWRAALASRPEADEVFTAAERRITALLPACPGRGDLVHGDLLHRNVLVQGDRPTAVFSWKCSVRGDFLFDTAWCTFWSGWHPGIAAADAWALTLADAPAADLVDAGLRHHCYELQIGASHLGWNIWIGDEPNLQACAERTASILQRGPL